MRHLITTFLLATSLSFNAFAAGDDIIKSWRDKQEAYFKGEALVQSNSVKAAQKLSKLIDKYKWEKGEQVKLMHKLAELYLGIGRVNETQENVKTDINTKRSLNLFKKIIKKHPKYEKLEYVLFSYGFELFMRGRHKESYKTLSQLNSWFPRSEFSIDAYVIRADSKFELRQYKKSINLYQKAINSNNMELAAYSSYRKAWAQFNSNMFNSAYRSLVNVINDKYKADKKIINPQKEAQNDLARFYQKQTKLFSPYSHISQLVDSSRLEKTLSELATLYFDSGQWNKSVSVYNSLISKFSGSKDKSVYYLRKGIALSTQKSLYKSSVAISKGLETCKSSECKVIANDEIFKMVNSWEKHWRKHQNSKTYLNALRTVYPKLADVATSNVERSKIYLLLAEVEVFSLNYELASIAYEKAYLNNKNASYANEAFWESINTLAKKKNLKFKKDLLKRLENLTSAYINKFPSSQRSIDAQNFIAKVYIASGKTKLATELYKDLSHKYMYSKTGQIAYDNYLKTQLKTKDYGDITDYLLNFRKLDKKKKKLTAVNSDLDKAYEDWSQSKIKSKKYYHATKVLKEALKYRKSSKLASEWKWNLAYTYLTSKKYRYAAEHFEEYESTYKNRNNKQVLALNNAFIAYKKIKSYKNATSVTNKLINFDRKNKHNWLVEKAILLRFRRMPMEAFKTLSQVESGHPEKNPLFFKIISKLNKKEIKQVLNSNLSGYTNESLAEAVLRLIVTIGDIDSRATKTAAVSLTNIKTNDKNYAARGYYLIGMHEMRKFSNRKYTISSKLEKSLNKMISKIMSIDENFRKAIEISSDETQPKALIAMGNLYSIVGKKYQPYSKKLLKNKVPMTLVYDLVSPFFDQSKKYWGEARRSINALKNKSLRKDITRLLSKSQKSSLALEKWYQKNSKIQFISTNGAK